MSLREDLVQEYRDKKNFHIQNPSPTKYKGVTNEHLALADDLSEREFAGMMLVVFGDHALGRLRELSNQIRATGILPGKMFKKETRKSIEKLLGEALGA